MDIIDFFDSDRIEQLAIHYACKTTTRPDITPAQRDKLKSLFLELNPSKYQRFTDTPGVPGVFQAVSEHSIGPGNVTVPSFVMDNSSLSFLFPLKLGGMKLSGVNIRSFFSTEIGTLNRDISSYMMKIHEVIGRGLVFQRAGKIFEVVLTPRNSDQKQPLFQNLIKYGLEKVSEVNLVITKLLEYGGTVYNLQARIGYGQNDLNQPFRLNIRVDINNRILMQDMEPSQMISVWASAETLISEHLSSIIQLD